MTATPDLRSERHRLIPHSPIPLYYQLAQVIRERVKDGTWPPGTTIPAEAELQQTYQVSRATVRRALEILVREELLERQRGRGTRVRQPRITRELPGLTSFSEEMRAAGHSPGSKTLSFQWVRQPDPVVAKALEHQADEEIAFILRLRFADGDLLGITHCYMPRWVWDRLQITPEQLDDQSLYAYMEHRAGLELVEADETVRVLPADPTMARQIKVRRGFPVVELERVVYTHDNVPIEYAVNYFRADKYQIRVRHRRVRKSRGSENTIG